MANEYTNTTSKLKSGVSVILPSFNGEEYILDQIRSIENQANVDIEIIVVDDGSTDMTLSLVQNHFGSSPDRKLVGFPHNRGQQTAIAVGVALASRMFVSFADQDDIWDPTKLEYSLEVLKSRPSAWAVFTDLQPVDAQLRNIGTSALQRLRFHPSMVQKWSLLLQNPVYGCTLLTETAKARASLPPPEGALHDRWLGYLAARESALAFGPRSTMRYRQHGNNQLGVAESKVVSLYRRSQSLAQFSKASTARRQRLVNMLGSLADATFSERVMRRYLGSGRCTRVVLLPAYLSLSRVLAWRTPWSVWALDAAAALPGSGLRS